MKSFVQPRDPLVGTTIGDSFHIEGKLGTGGMGTVYLARQEVTERPIALKIVHPQLIDDTMLQRFEREAVVVSGLNHPNIVTVFAYGQDEAGPLYIAMERVEGRTIGQLIEAEGRLQLDRALEIAIQCAEALAYAHEKGVIHRDIKPDNIMVTQVVGRDVVKLLDFGLARVVDTESFQTTTGKVFGSPAFMSLEQWHAVKDIDGRTDIFSLGAVIYFALTGEFPWKAAHPLGYAQAVQVPPEAPSMLRPELAERPGFEAAVMRCLATQREDRYPDAMALVDALRALRTGSGPTLPRIDPAAPVAHATTQPVLTSQSGLGSQSTVAAMDTGVIPPPSRGPWLLLAALLAIGVAIALPFMGDTPAPAGGASAASQTGAASAPPAEKPTAAQANMATATSMVADATQNRDTATPRADTAKAVLSASTDAEQADAGAPDTPVSAAPAPPDANAPSSPELAATATSAKAVTVTVDSLPPGAEVVVAGITLGTAPVKLNIAPGRRVEVMVRSGNRVGTRELTYEAVELLHDKRIVIVASPSRRDGKRKKFIAPSKKPVAAPEKKPTKKPSLKKLPIE